jgi:hypothetical protein
MTSEVVNYQKAKSDVTLFKPTVLLEFTNGKEGSLAAVNNKNREIDKSHLFDASLKKISSVIGKSSDLKTDILSMGGKNKTTSSVHLIF